MSTPRNFFGGIIDSGGALVSPFVPSYPAYARYASFGGFESAEAHSAKAENGDRVLDSRLRGNEPRMLTGVRHRPYSLTARGRRLPFSVPRINRGDGAPSGASSAFRAHASFGRCGASRRAIAASYRRRAALSDRELPRPSASSSQGVIVPPGGVPGAARVQEERSSPARGRRILLHHLNASNDAPE